MQPCSSVIGQKEKKYQILPFPNHMLARLEVTCREPCACQRLSVSLPEGILWPPCGAGQQEWRPAP